VLYSKGRRHPPYHRAPLVRRLAQRPALPLIINPASPCSHPLSAVGLPCLPHWPLCWQQGLCRLRAVRGGHLHAHHRRHELPELPLALYESNGRGALLMEGVGRARGRRRAPASRPVRVRARLLTRTRVPVSPSHRRHQPATRHMHPTRQFGQPYASGWMRPQPSFDHCRASCHAGHPLFPQASGMHAYGWTTVALSPL
jgi:hypothetical protein